VWSRETRTFWNGKLLCGSPDGETLLIASLDMRPGPEYGKGWYAVRGVAPADVTLVRPGGKGQGKGKRKGKR
jgi:hypothetical protein